MTPNRIAIVGGPHTGKTELAARFPVAEAGRVYHTDDVMGLGWSEASEAVADWFNRQGPWVIEGVAVPRALRKWLAANEDGAPCETVAVLRHAWTPLTKGQASMATGVHTVFNGIRDELERRGVAVVELW